MSSYLISPARSTIAYRFGGASVLFRFDPFLRDKPTSGSMPFHWIPFGITVNSYDARQKANWILRLKRPIASGHNIYIGCNEPRLYI